MKRVFCLLLLSTMLCLMTACGETGETGAKPDAAQTQVETQTSTQSQAMSASAAQIYAAFLAQFDTLDVLYATDINHDGYPEVIVQPTFGVSQYVLTYTEKGGLSVLCPQAHSSMGVHFRFSDNNCLYFTDDGHNYGTADYHVGFVYSIGEEGFVLQGKAFGEPWPEVGERTDEIVEELNKKYDRIFDEKIHAITGDGSFVDFEELTLPEDGQAVLKDSMGIDVAAAASAYRQTEVAARNAVQSATGDTVSAVYVSDYDRNGTFEAFVYVADTELNDEVACGRCWFVDDRGEVEALGDYFCSTEEMRIYTLTYHDYFQAPVFAGSSYPSQIWTVENGKCKEIELAKNTDFTMDCMEEVYSTYFDPGTYSATLNAFDSSIDNTVKEEEYGAYSGAGHTHKPYFFHDTPQGIAEYRGAKITTQAFSEHPGAQPIMDFIAQNGGTVRNVFRRENGVYNVSYFVPQEGSKEFFYINALEAEGKLYVIDPYSCDLAALDEDCIGTGFYIASVSS